MNPRLRRLFADHQQMIELADRTPAVSFRADGNPPESYELLINVPGLARDGDGRVILRHLHRCTAYLHADYPRRPPVITWQTPIVHPNILSPDRNGGVCLGGWSASESLADVVRRLIALVSYRAFNAEDPLDKATAAWVKERRMRPGVDLQTLLDSDGGHGLVDVKLRGTLA